MNIKNPQNASRSKISNKEVRDELLKILKDIHSSDIYNRELNRNRDYTRNKKEILSYNDEWWVDEDNNEIYPKASMKEMIKVLEKVEDRNVEDIKRLIDSSKILDTGGSLFLQHYRSGDIDIRIIRLEAFHQDVDDAGSYYQVYIEISKYNL